MDVKSYCDMLENQLVAWKAKIYDVIRVVDTGLAVLGFGMTPAPRVTNSYHYVINASGVLIT